MPKVQGEIRQVLADEGQRVRAGQLLARLDGDKLRLEVALNEATHEQLDRDYKRNLGAAAEGSRECGLARQPRATGSMPPRPTWELARLQLSYCDIRSPIDGTVSAAARRREGRNTVTPVGGVIESGSKARCSWSRTSTR